MPERNEVINAEVDRLLEAQHIREVHYPVWLANTVVVPKKGGKWRVCVDYTDLNKACPMDSNPIPKIDQLVDSIAGNELLFFMDAYSGYNQIRCILPTNRRLPSSLAKACTVTGSCRLV